MPPDHQDGGYLENRTARLCGLDRSPSGSRPIRRDSSSSLVGTYRSRKSGTAYPAVAIPNSDPDRVIEFLRKENVTSVVNLTRGETDLDFLLHRKIIKYGESAGAHYHYLSSFNACDAQLTHDHKESEPPMAQSDYGKFKARCELALMESSIKFSIFRFSAIHGWAAHRCARTKEFLKKISAGKRLVVPRGILQNRLAVTDLSKMIAAVVTSGGQGVFHLGTMDAVEAGPVPRLKSPLTAPAGIPHR